MKGADCKLPIQEDFHSFLNNGKIDPSSRQKKLLVAAGFLLVVTMSIMIGFTFKALTEISELRKELEQLKSSFETLHKKVIDTSDYSDFTEDLTQLDYNDDYYDISYEDDADDDGNLEDYYKDNDVITDDDSKPVLTGEQYTKDAKQATAPPRTKRNIIGYNQDGIPINVDSYDEAKKKNISITNRRSYFTTAVPPSSYSNSFYPRPRISQDVETHTTSKSVHAKRPKSLQSKNSNYIKSSDLQYSGENPDVEFAVVGDDQIPRRTRHRQRRLEDIDETVVRPGRMRPLPTAHFSGDTSKYVLGQHDNFDGNGRLRHPRRTFVDWAESSWFRTLGMDRHFSLYDGVLTIKDAGLYFVYAQIYYLDVHDTNGFRVYKNESDTILQCTTMTHSIDKVTKGNTCFTAAAEYLQENDRISLGDLSDSRYSLFEPGKSFFGVIKLGDVKIK